MGGQWHAQTGLRATLSLGNGPEHRREHLGEAGSIDVGGELEGDGSALPRRGEALQDEAGRDHVAPLRRGDHRLDHALQIVGHELLGDECPPGTRFEVFAKISVLAEGVARDKPR
jgi:hypothetical protein